MYKKTGFKLLYEESIIIYSPYALYSLWNLCIKSTYFEGGIIRIFSMCYVWPFFDSYFLFPYVTKYICYSWVKDKKNQSNTMCLTVLIARINCKYDIVIRYINLVGISCTYIMNNDKCIFFIFRKFNNAAIDKM